MYSKILNSFILITIIVIAGCASTGKWSTVSIPSNPDYLYAPGTGQSKDLQLAIDKATLSARTEIARQLETKLNNLQKSFAEEVESGDNTEINHLYSNATKEVVSAQLTGSRIKESKYRENKGKYEAQVIVEYPLATAKAALVDKIKQDKNLYTQFKASQGFKELETEIEKWKKDNK